MLTASTLRGCLASLGFSVSVLSPKPTELSQPMSKRSPEIWRLKGNDCQYDLRLVDQLILVIPRSLIASPHD